ncbi:LysR family transcriptional regulator [Shewanella eurypsychrophilus]|uniref:LysR family transcriptional regulator n=1 Tax=Shewanella eurypsychrophilus TaxID=2593656 RepID=A0ABX6VDH3_9GAMM|nr:MULTISPECIES: LysR substrate-binding domain-containing protein [Shewanella]QFU24768.1 LysR family transcriptional regulator [Shewanella sp. YLB-09]QPG59958.1 LysR family transcriptional regulator [Shewanella eurypsychrophilus]
MRKIPPLRALQVFEAAARQEHFSRAAEELCITQSAVSHQVKVLEEHFSEQLFRREGRQLKLTSKGKLLYQELTQIFDSLSSLNQQVSGGESQELRLAVYSSFAVKWLIPRLSHFRRQYPDIKIRLNMITDDPELSDSVADMFISGQNGHPGFWHKLLHQERLIPVCAPELFDIGETIEVTSLFKQPLLTVDEGPLGLDWPRWSQANQVIFPPSQQEHIFSHVLLAIEAAIAGQGVALASDFMVMNDIADKRLIALNLPDIYTGFEFNFSCKKSRVKEPAIAAFITWICTQN